MNKVLNYLDELIPNPVCELVYHHDYELLIAVILSAQTTDKRVNKVTAILFDKYPTLVSLKEASIDDLYKILKPIGMYHKKANFIKEVATELHDNYDDRVPHDRKSLESLSGVGRKTANVVMAILFNEPYMAVDTHVARVSKRLGLASKKDNVLAIERKLMKIIPQNRVARTHYQLVLFGRYYCTAIKPKCRDCQLIDICKYEKRNT